MTRPVTVVVIQSLSYTGTTWLNLVLGSHPEAFALGPADRPYALSRAEAATACRVHGESCPFWPGFYESWNEGENFFVHLAERSGKRIIVINNPIPGGAADALKHRDVVVRPISFVRDGRAIAESYVRKQTTSSFFDVVRDWLAPSFNSIEFDTADPDRLCLRYEDVLEDQVGMLRSVGEFLSINYEESALRFWEHEQHLAAGNVGPVMMIKMHQGIELPRSARDKQFYQDQYRKTVENPAHQFESSRWQQALSPRERFIFDVFCGEKNGALGYERDRFTLDEVRQFSSELNLALELPRVEEPAEPNPEPIGVPAPAHEIGRPSPRPNKSPSAFVAVILAAVILGAVSLLAASGVF